MVKPEKTDTGPLDISFTLGRDNYQFTLTLTTVGRHELYWIARLRFIDMG